MLGGLYSASIAIEIDKEILSWLYHFTSRRKKNSHWKGKVLEKREKKIKKPLGIPPSAWPKEQCMMNVWFNIICTSVLRLKLLIIWPIKVDCCWVCEGGSPPSTGRSDCRKPLSPHPLFRRPSRSVSVDSETGPVSVSQLIPAPSSRYCLRYRVATLRTLALHLRPRFPNEFIGKGSIHMFRHAGLQHDRRLLYHADKSYSRRTPACWWWGRRDPWLLQGGCVFSPAVFTLLCLLVPDCKMTNNYNVFMILSFF